MLTFSEQPNPFLPDQYVGRTFRERDGKALVLITKCAVKGYWTVVNLTDASSRDVSDVRLREIVDAPAYWVEVKLIQPISYQVITR